MVIRSIKETFPLNIKASNRLLYNLKTKKYFFLLGLIPLSLEGKHFHELCLIIKEHMAMICVQFKLNRAGYLIGTWLGKRESSTQPQFDFMSCF